MDKDRLYEAAVCEVKRNTLKHFKPDCFKTDVVCAFNMPFQCMHAKPRCQMSLSVAKHQLGASQQHYPSHFLSPFTMNVVNQLCHPCRYKTLAKMCEERITCTKLNAHQSSLKIDFLLLSMSFLPVDVAYKMTD